jgi:hypothetical protein
MRSADIPSVVTENGFLAKIRASWRRSTKAGFGDLLAIDPEVVTCSDGDRVVEPLGHQTGESGAGDLRVGGGPVRTRRVVPLLNWRPWGVPVPRTRRTLSASENRSQVAARSVDLVDPGKDAGRVARRWLRLAEGSM